MISFKLIDLQTALDVSSSDSVDDIEAFLLNFERGSINSNLSHVTYGYPVYCQRQQIGWVALSDDDASGLVVHHYSMRRVELLNRWDIRNFYSGEYDNKAPF